MSLVATIALRTLCKVEFDRSGKVIVSGIGGVEKGSKSKQTIKPIEVDGDLFADTENVIELSCADLVEALSVPTADKVAIGLSNPVGSATRNLFVIQQTNEPEWRHVMLRSTEAV